MADIIEIPNPDLPASTGGKALAKTRKSGKKNRQKQAEPEQKKFGRPVAQIDWVQVEKLANIFTPIPEISYVTGHSVDTLEKYCKLKFGSTLAVWWKSKAANGKMSLRRAMLSQAIGLEHDGWVREKDGSIARDPEGYPLQDKRKQRQPNTMVLLYMARHVLDMEGVGLPYDPEHNEDAEDEREGSETVYPITFVGRPEDEVDESPAPGAEEILEVEAEEYYPDASGLKPHSATSSTPNPYDIDYQEYGDTE